MTAFDNEIFVYLSSMFILFIPLFKLFLSHNSLVLFIKIKIIFSINQKYQFLSIFFYFGYVIMHNEVSVDVKNFVELDVDLVKNFGCFIY